MQPREAAELLTLMRGTWPTLARDEVANQLWLDDLVQLEQRSAVEAFRSLRNTQERAPAWALFREAYAAQARRFEPRRDEIEAPPEPRPTDEQKQAVHDLVHALKDHLTGRKKVLDPKPLARFDRQHSGFDALDPMLTYEELYEGDPA